MSESLEKRILILPFRNVGTYQPQRNPNVLLADDVMTWLENHSAHHSFLIGMNKDPNNWRVQFQFEQASDALLFKLTFGGA